MRLMKYTCRANGQNFEHEGYFTNVDLMRYWLSYWSGDTFQYFENAEQRSHNEAVPLLAKDYRYPYGAICRWGKQPHEYNCITQYFR